MARVDGSVDAQLRFDSPVTIEIISIESGLVLMTQIVEPASADGRCGLVNEVSTREEVAVCRELVLLETSAHRQIVQENTVEIIVHPFGVQTVEWVTRHHKTKSEMILESFFNLLPKIEVIWAAIALVELLLYPRYDGKLKRGAKIWSEPLSENMRRFLRRLPGDVVDKETGAFIRKENNTVLVRPQLKARRTLLTYVAYIDLRVKEPRIQYRVPISTSPFIIVPIAIGAWLGYQQPAMILLLLVNSAFLIPAHKDKRKKILQFITETMRSFHA